MNLKTPARYGDIEVVAAKKDAVMNIEEWKTLPLRELLEKPEGFRSTHVLMASLSVIDQDPTTAISPNMVEALRNLALEILRKQD